MLKLTEEMPELDIMLILEVLGPLRDKTYTLQNACIYFEDSS